MIASEEIFSRDKKAVALTDVAVEEDPILAGQKDEFGNGLQQGAMTGFAFPKLLFGALTRDAISLFESDALLEQDACEGCITQFMTRLNSSLKFSRF